MLTVDKAQKIIRRQISSLKETETLPLTFCFERVCAIDIKKKGFRYFLRAKRYWQDGSYFTRTTGLQGSAILSSMAEANSLIVLPEDEEYILGKGSRVMVRFLN